MFTLQRNGDVFRIHKEDLGATASGAGSSGRTQESGPSDQAVPTPDMRTPGLRAAGRVHFRQWEQFMRTGTLTVTDCDPHILDSWKRCRDWQVDPSPRSCWDFTPVDQLEAFASTFQRIAGTVERRIYEAIKGRNLLMTVADHHGRLVRTCGDVDTLRKADKLNFGPGANWAETSVGTNAIGTSIVTGRPMQVFAEEHYCQSHHSWCCTAAPILDPHGSVWGCFDISGPTDSDHSQSLRLVMEAARELERQLSSAYLQELEYKSRSLISAVFNAVLTGVLTVDEHGRITNANQAAAALLGLELDALRGRLADSLLDYRAFVTRQRAQPSNGEAMTIACWKNPQLIARAALVSSENGKWGHTIVTLTEPQRTRPASTPSHRAATQAAYTPPTTATGTTADAGFAKIIGHSPALLLAIKKARQAAKTPSTVLLCGETGTGKELFAQGIHQASARAGGPFVAVNCGALARELAQSELFGYRAGSFTGADDKGRIGKFEQAHRGTLFLDEISEMPLELQVNLLRPLEERCVVRVGGAKSRTLDVKVVAATNKDLFELVEQGLFREDLYYRINVVAIQIPPLRERPEDIPLLVEHHARRLCAAFRLPFEGIAPEAMCALCDHHWPGNVRELINCIEAAVNLMEDGLLRLDDLPARILAGRRPAPAMLSAAFSTRGEAAFPAVPGPAPAQDLLQGLPQGLPHSLTLENVAEGTIRAALERHGGNISQTARALGIGRNTLYAKMRKFGIC
ncbi:sigma-54-dependent Fis family transcriptional regulator [Megalodesulfovibrio paquesii]